MVGGVLSARAYHAGKQLLRTIVCVCVCVCVCVWKETAEIRDL
jgi:hypothetical protein